MVRFRKQRGTAEQHIKEGKYAFRWTRLSCKRFRDNEVRLQLHALTYNLATFLRCIELPEEWPNGRRHRPDGARHTRSRPPPSSAPVVRLRMIEARTERTRLDRCIRCSEKRHCEATMRPLRDLFRPPQTVYATTGAARSEKNLSEKQIQAILTSHGTPLGEYRFNWVPVTPSFLETLPCVAPGP